MSQGPRTCLEGFLVAWRFDLTNSQVKRIDFSMFRGQKYVFVEIICCVNLWTHSVICAIERVISWYIVIYLCYVTRYIAVYRDISRYAVICAYIASNHVISR